MSKTNFMCRTFGHKYAKHRTKLVEVDPTIGSDVAVSFSLETLPCARCNEIKFVPTVKVNLLAASKTVATKGRTNVKSK